MIRSFGEFVAGDKVVVGLIIFVIIVVIQFVVITKGATRISEVAARFALDGMPGRQMAIDADLNAGVIDEKEAQRRRTEITLQADFYGAMDGASKFVRGDAIAGIIITLINIVGGLIIGVWEARHELRRSRLAVHEADDRRRTGQPGSGLSDLAGRRFADHPQHAEVELAERFHPAAVLATASVGRGRRIPGHPGLHEPAAHSSVHPGSGCCALAVMLSKQKRQEAAAASATARADAEKAKKPDERIEDYLAVDPMEIEIGVGLIRLADPSRGGDLLPRITGVRQAVAADIGIVLPKVRIRDNMRLGENQYRIKIANNPVAEAVVYPDRLLAMDSGMTTGVVPGEATRDPAFQQPAVWIEHGVRDRAEMLGYTPVDPAAVLATHLQEVVRRHADELLTRDATKHLIDELKHVAPAVVDELIPGVMKLGDVQQVLQLLLREQVPIRQLGMILETLGDYAPRTKDPIWLTEYVRHRLARTLCTRYRDSDNRLFVITLDPALEERIAAGLEHNERGLFIRMSPQAVETTCALIAAAVGKLTQGHHPPVVLVSPQIRPGLKQLTAGNLPDLHVLSYNEMTRDTQIESVGIVNDATGGGR